MRSEIGVEKVDLVSVVEIGTRRPRKEVSRLEFRALRSELNGLGGKC